MDFVIIIFLMALAMMLILVEIFLLPGITFAGIGGGLFAVGSIVYAYMVSTLVGNITLGVSIVVFVAVFFWMLRSNSFKRVALHTEVDSTLTSMRDLDICVGDEGITLSRLAPIGKAKIKNLIIEAKSREEFIDEQTPIKVIRIDGYNVIVVPVNESE